jgi:hypothetical protein
MFLDTNTGISCIPSPHPGQTARLGSPPCRWNSWRSWPPWYPCRGSTWCGMWAVWHRCSSQCPSPERGSGLSSFAPCATPPWIQSLVSTIPPPFLILTHGRFSRATGWCDLFPLRTTAGRIFVDTAKKLTYYTACSRLSGHRIRSMLMYPIRTIRLESGSSTRRPIASYSSWD